MQDMREVVYDLVVNQLGVKRASYLGHSLGGQLVMGYALTWPDAVQGLRSKLPAGPKNIRARSRSPRTRRLRLFDESFGRDFDKWKQTWDQTGILAAEMARPEQNIRDFFYFKKRDPVTGAVRRPRAATS